MQQHGWGPPPGKQGPSGSFGPAQPAPPVARKIGFFESIPCPHCGMGMRSHAGWGAVAGRMAGGLVGWLVVSALASSYYCGQHGEIAKAHLPAEHQSLVMTRRVLMVGGAGALLLFVFGLICLSGLLQEMRY